MADVTITRKGSYMGHVCNVETVQESYNAGSPCFFLLDENGNFIAGFNAATTDFEHNFPNPERIGFPKTEGVDPETAPASVAKTTAEAK